MFTTLMVTALLTCKPYHPPMPPPPPQTVSCEGADQVRRDLEGVELSRVRFAASCMSVRCEGFDFVSRDSRGLELSREPATLRCMPPRPRPVRLTSDPLPVRFGLSSRG